MWILPKNLHPSVYVPDMEALSLDLNESSQLCAQSLFVRSKALPARTWSQKWKRDSWTQHLFGRILRPSHGQSFEIRWTFFLEVTPASHLVQPESEPEQMTQDTCGHLSQVAFKWYDPDCASSRMWKDTLHSDSEKSLQTWRALVTKRRGEYSQRLSAARLTSGKGCSSWPTAAARDYKGESGSGRQERKGHPMDTLPNAVAQWPSLVASEVRQGFQDRSRGMKGSQESLTTVVIKTSGPVAPANHSTHGSRLGSWPTPDTNNHRDGTTLRTDNNLQQGGFHGVSLHHAVESPLSPHAKAWATPRSCEHKENGPNSKQQGLCNQVVVEKSATLATGKLNPRWVETLMGLPVGWTMPNCACPVTIAPTSCACLATESFQQQQL